jgi:cytochrome c-type biogenesis protein CcmH
MIAFWVAAALMVTGALLFVVTPLVRAQPAPLQTRKKKRAVQSKSSALLVAIHRDALRELGTDLSAGKLTPAAYEESKGELLRRLLEETAAVPTAARQSHGSWTAAILVVTMPVCAVSLFLLMGRHSAFAPVNTTAVQATTGQGPSSEQFAQRVEQLAARLRNNPNDAQGWYTLGRSYQLLRQLPLAAEAYSRAAALMPDDPNVLADYADTLSAVNGRNLSGKPTELIQQALRLDPNHQKALAVAGTAAFNSGDYPVAIDYFQRLLKTFPPDSDNARSVAASIAKARAAIDARTLAGSARVPSNRPLGPGVQAPTIAGMVTMNRALSAKVLSTDTLFIVARAANGPTTPLAVMRAQAKDLPKAFRLDDSMAMSPALKLSNYQSVVVFARISKSGDATPASGDLFGSAGPMTVGSSDVKVVIDSVVP